jgi:hypothetical protein
VTPAAARELCKRARSAPGTRVRTGEWCAVAVRVYHRGRTGPAWTFVYDLEHPTHRPQGGSFPSVSSLVQYVEILAREELALELAAAPELAPCRCGRVPALSLLNGSEWHLVCSGTCDGVYAAGPELARVAAEWAALQAGPDMRCGAPGAL